ncbi:sucrase/ferredoxin domain-containing protein [Xylariaceae sp. FL0662B]|nr:sucrase/ferredoxin domain-containing protein [Xylariaceae sp. FL0662B]
MTTIALVFRILYTSAYVLLCLLLAALLLVTPGDIIHQIVLYTSQYLNLVIIAIVYVLTVLVVLFIYAIRLYITRTVLGSIPKNWIPIEKGDVTKEVRRMVVTSLSRSAAIAWEARPKVISPEPPQTLVEDPAEETVTNGRESREPRRSLQLFKSKPPATVEDEMGIALPPVRPVWGEIEHNGWGSPASTDLPNLQYSTVLSELPNLIEAKAVSHAHPDPDSTMAQPTLDGDAIVLLQRASNMTMRDYVLHLITLGVLPSSPQTSEFIDAYERARFSTRPMSNAHFRHLMHLFAELLREMQPLEPANLYVDNESEYPDPDDTTYSFDSSGHIDDDAPEDTNTPTTYARSISSTSAPSFDGSSTRSRARPSRPARNSSSHTWHQYRTAPTTPKSKVSIAGGGRPISHSSSANSMNTFAQTRRPYYPSSSASASASLRSGSSTKGSIIRLATREDGGDLPYVLRLADTL